MKFARHEHLADDLKVDTVWWASLKLTALALPLPAALGRPRPARLAPDPAGANARRPRRSQTVGLPDRGLQRGACLERRDTGRGDLDGLARAGIACRARRPVARRERPEALSAAPPRHREAMPGSPQASRRAPPAPRPPGDPPPRPSPPPVPACSFSGLPFRQRNSRFNHPAPTNPGRHFGAEHLPESHCGYPWCGRWIPGVSLRDQRLNDARGSRDTFHHGLTAASPFKIARRPRQLIGPSTIRHERRRPSTGRNEAAAGRSPESAAAS